VSCIWVLAGTNGAGKSSVAGELLRRSGGDYLNPDEAARRLRLAQPRLTQSQANAAAWAAGVSMLDDAIRERREYFFETTLGGKTIAGRLESALDQGIEVRIWYVGLVSLELHLARVAARVARGGHDIPEADVRRRYDAGRRTLVRLLPRLTELNLFDNSADADPAEGATPMPEKILHLLGGRIVAIADPRETPEWAKPIVAAALRL
jgi:predicted ABC-type ATPase